MPFFGLRSTDQMSLAARLTAGTTFDRTLGIQRTTPTSAAPIAIAPREMLTPELDDSTVVAVMAAAIRNRIIWIAPPTPVESTIALAPEATGTSWWWR